MDDNVYRMGSKSVVFERGKKKYECLCAMFFSLHSTTSIVSAIRWYRPLPRCQIRIYTRAQVSSNRGEREREMGTPTCIRVDMIINILHRRISSRITTDIRIPFPLIDPHIIEPQFRRKDHRRQIDSLPIRRYTQIEHDRHGFFRYKSLSNSSSVRTRIGTYGARSESVSR